MYKHILVATDGSELAQKGLEHGLALARQLEAKITVLTVTDPLNPEAVRAAKEAGVDNPAVRYDQQIANLMKERFAAIEASAADHGVAVELAHEIDDAPAEAIVRHANLNACDLIVMTSHGRRGVQKLILGSQTSEVLVKTSVPVLVVR